MTEIKYDKSHHAGGTPEARIAARLRNSGETKEEDHSVVHGTGPTRTHTNIHVKGNVLQRGSDEKGVDIYGNTRGPANRDGEI
jgi:hypothetical protein